MALSGMLYIVLDPVSVFIKPHSHSKSIRQSRHIQLCVCRATPIPLTSGWQTLQMHDFLHRIYAPVYAECDCLVITFLIFAHYSVYYQVRAGLVR